MTDIIVSWIIAFLVALSIALNGGDWDERNRWVADFANSLFGEVVCDAGDAITVFEDGSWRCDIRR